MGRDGLRRRTPLVLRQWWYEMRMNENSRDCDCVGASHTKRAENWMLETHLMSYPFSVAEARHDAVAGVPARKL